MFQFSPRRFTSPDYFAIVVTDSLERDWTASSIFERTVVYGRTRSTRLAYPVSAEWENEREATVAFSVLAGGGPITYEGQGLALHLIAAD